MAGDERQGRQSRPNTGMRHMAQIGIAQALAIQASTWGRLIATCVAHMTEHLYMGVITVVLPVMAPALGLSMSQVGLSRIIKLQGSD